MKKIAVTGANGQLGSEIRKLSSSSGHTFLFSDIDTLDLLNREQTDAYFAEHKPDIIINCAAYTNVDKAEEEEEIAESLNAEIPRRLAEYSRNSGGKFIHISTDYVFPGTHTQPLKETDIPNPQGAYGRTKLKGEEAIRDLENVVIIRTAWLYSSFGKNFVKSMLHYFGERDEMRIVFDQVGTPTYAEDLAAAIMKIIDEPNDRIVPGIYHYTNEGVCSWYDFALEIRDISGISCNIVPIESRDFPLPAPRPHFSLLNKEKIKKQYNIEIPHWKYSLKKCIDLINKV